MCFLCKDRQIKRRKKKKKSTCREAVLLGAGRWLLPCCAPAPLLAGAAACGWPFAGCWLGRWPLPLPACRAVRRAARLLPPPTIPPACAPVATNTRRYAGGTPAHGRSPAGRFGRVDCRETNRRRDGWVPYSYFLLGWLTYLFGLRNTSWPTKEQPVVFNLCSVSSPLLPIMLGCRFSFGEVCADCKILIRFHFNKAMAWQTFVHLWL